MHPPLPFALAGVAVCRFVRAVEGAAEFRGEQGVGYDAGKNRLRSLGTAGDGMDCRTEAGRDLGSMVREYVSGG